MHVRAGEQLMVRLFDNLAAFALREYGHIAVVGSPVMISS